MKKKHTEHCARVLLALLLLMALILLLALIGPCALAEGSGAETARPVISLTEVVEAVFKLIAALICCRLIPWIKAKTSAETQKRLDAAIRVAVYAAEQLYGANQGETKLRHALETLKQAGYDIKDRAVMDGVEAAVQALTLEAAKAQPFEVLDAKEDNIDPGFFAAVTPAQIKNE